MVYLGGIYSALLQSWLYTCSNVQKENGITEHWHWNTFLRFSASNKIRFGSTIDRNQAYIFVAK